MESGKVDARPARRVYDVSPSRQPGERRLVQNVTCLRRQWTMQANEVRPREELIELVAALNAECLVHPVGAIRIIEGDSQAQGQTAPGHGRANATTADDAEGPPAQPGRPIHGCQIPAARPNG